MSVHVVNLSSFKVTTFLREIGNKCSQKEVLSDVEKVLVFLNTQHFSCVNVIKLSLCYSKSFHRKRS